MKKVDMETKIKYIYTHRIPRVNWKKSEVIIDGFFPFFWFFLFVFSLVVNRSYCWCYLITINTNLLAHKLLLWFLFFFFLFFLIIFSVQAKFIWCDGCHHCNFDKFAVKIFWLTERISIRDSYFFVVFVFRLWWLFGVGFCCEYCLFWSYCEEILLVLFFLYVCYFFFVLNVITYII